MMNLHKNPDTHYRMGGVAAILRTIAISILSLVVLFSASNCSPSVPQKEYDSLKNKATETERQLVTLQDKLAEAAKVQAQYQSLNTQFAELQKQLNAKNTEIQAMAVKFDDLNSKYKALQTQYDARNSELQAIQTAHEKLKKELEDLKRQYGTVVQGAAVFTENDIEQAIFQLINQERRNSGVKELAWSSSLYNQAKLDNRKMAETGTFQNTGSDAAWREVFMAAKYGTIDQIADAALLTWKNNEYRFKQGIINTQNKYGAVTTYKYGEIYYITFMASIFG